jgi:hypothetical protein
MLIIGDYASVKHINTDKPKVLEIIYETNEKEDILSKLKIDKKPFYTKYGLEYYYTDKNIRLYNANDNKIIKSFYDKSMSNNNIRIASLFFNYSLYKARVKFRSDSIREWEENFIKYTDYKEKIIPYLDKSKMATAITNYQLLTYYNYIQQNTNSVSYMYNTYLVYDKFELYTLLSEELNPPSEKLIKDFKTFELDLKVWNNFNDDSKLEAIMEFLYVDNATEYLIPQIESTSMMPKDAFQYFIYCIMNLMTSPIYPDWIKCFIENNYRLIINTYRGDYVENLGQLVRHNVLKPVK